jgi:membrane associated rhomboid family serine protease
MTGRQPMFNIPASVVVTALAMIVLHVIRVALPSEESLYMLLALAFVPARYAGATPGLPGGEWSQFTSFITYMFVHGDATHLIINMVWMLAFGSAVAKRIGDLRFVIFSLLCGIAGVLLHLVLHFGEFVPVVGASAAISGQMAGAIRFMFSSSRQGVPMSHDLKEGPLAGIGETLTNPRFLMFLGVWVALNLLFGLGGMQLDGSGAGIAWEAHMGGFICGLFIFGVFDRTVRSDGSRPTYVYKDD